MTDTQMDKIRIAALTIFEQIEKPEDRYQVNRFLADLDLHNLLVLRIISRWSKNANSHDDRSR
jgi:hypothetical protein